MGSLNAKRFDDADEVRTPDKTRIEIVDVGGIKVAKMTAQPGWRWSECIKPVAGTDSCQVHHLGVVTEGQLHVVHDDGSETDLAPGGAYEVTPGHDAWVVGDAEFVAYEFDPEAVATFARPA